MQGSMIRHSNGKCHSTRYRPIVIQEITTHRPLTVHSIHHLISYHPSIPRSTLCSICLPIPNKLSITPRIQQLPTLIQPYIPHTLRSICLLAASHSLILCSILHRIWILTPNYPSIFLTMVTSLANQQPPRPTPPLEPTAGTSFMHDAISGVLDIERDLHHPIYILDVVCI